MAVPTWAPAQWPRPPPPAAASVVGADGDGEPEHATEVQALELLKFKMRWGRP